LARGPQPDLQNLPFGERTPDRGTVRMSRLQNLPFRARTPNRGTVRMPQHDLQNLPFGERSPDRGTVRMSWLQNLPRFGAPGLEWQVLHAETRHASPPPGDRDELSAPQTANAAGDAVA
jgi:hypothetical protein